MKLTRHGQILKLIQEYAIETQEELAEKLNDSGFKVTQATVSRDIKELKLTKIVSSDGHSRYAVVQNQDREIGSRYIQVLKSAYVSMDTAQNLLVLKTVSGMAMAAAAALDDLELSGIVGCIAGDNTVMCAAKSSDAALVAMATLKKMLEDD